MVVSKHVRARITSRHDLTAELWVVRLAPEEKISFSPGQYLTVGLPDGNRLIERPYSVASGPREAELEFFVELVREGQLTPQLYTVPVGGEVLMRRAAKGRFLFDEPSGRPNHFMVATVTGVAPFLSMVRELVARQAEGGRIPYRVVLLHSASVSEELGYADELTACSRAHSWLSYVPTVSRVWLDSGWTGEVGRAEDVLRKHLDGFGFKPGDTTAYLCGNPNMIHNAKQVLERAGFSKESMKEEQYWVETEPRA